jgi:hypothetical protein
MVVDLEHQIQTGITFASKINRILSLPLLESMSWREKKSKKRREKSRSGQQKHVDLDHYKNQMENQLDFTWSRAHLLPHASKHPSTEPDSSSKADNLDAGAEPQRQRLGRHEYASGIESGGSPPASSPSQRTLSHCAPMDSIASPRQ